MPIKYKIEGSDLHRQLPSSLILNEKKFTQTLYAYRY